MSNHVLSIAQINEYIRGVMDRDALLSSVYVRGEISNYKVYPSGHHYRGQGYWQRLSDGRRFD